MRVTSRAARFSFKLLRKRRAFKWSFAPPNSECSEVVRGFSAWVLLARDDAAVVMGLADRLGA